MHTSFCWCLLRSNALSRIKILNTFDLDEFWYVLYCDLNEIFFSLFLMWRTLVSVIIRTIICGCCYLFGHYYYLTNFHFYGYVYHIQTMPSAERVWLSWKHFLTFGEVLCYWIRRPTAASPIPKYALSSFRSSFTAHTSTLTNTTNLIAYVCVCIRMMNWRYLCLHYTSLFYNFLFFFFYIFQIFTYTDRSIIVEKLL